jgi:hypothetical protein
MSETKFEGRRPVGTFRPNSGTSSTTPMVPIPVQVVSYDLAPGNAINVEQDCMRCLLLADVPAYGLTATFDENNSPTTEIVARLSKLPKDGKGDGRREIRELGKRKGQGDALPEGSVVLLEKAKVVNGEIIAAYTHGGPTPEKMNAALPLAKIHPNATFIVKPTFRKNKETGIIETGVAQDIIMAWNDMAALVTTEEEVKSYLAETFNAMEDALEGRPGVQLIARQLFDDLSDPAERVVAARDVNSRISAMSYVRDKQVDNVWVPMTSDDVYNSLFASSEGKFIKSLIGNPVWQIDFVPLSVFGQVASLLPAKQKADKKRDPLKAIRDNSEKHAMYDYLDPSVKVNDEGYAVFNGGKRLEPSYVIGDGKRVVRMDHAYMQGPVIVERSRTDNDGAYSTYQNNSSYTLVPTENLNTPNMPVYHAEATKEDSARLSDIKRQVVTIVIESIKAAKEARAAAPAPLPGR